MKMVAINSFPLFGAFYHWFPKMTGRLMNEALGKINFWVLFIGFNLTFFPMHILGLKGMTRRIYTYPPEMGWARSTCWRPGEHASSRSAACCF